MYVKRVKIIKLVELIYNITDGYHDKEKGYTKIITVKSLGYLETLKKQYKYPISHFTEVVKQINEVKKGVNKEHRSNGIIHGFYRNS